VQHTKTGENACQTHTKWPQHRYAF
jgi:hypothetical protein